MGKKLLKYKEPEFFIHSFFEKDVMMASGVGDLKDPSSDDIDW